MICDYTPLLIYLNPIINIITGIGILPIGR